MCVFSFTMVCVIVADILLGILFSWYYVVHTFVWSPQLGILGINHSDVSALFVCDTSGSQTAFSCTQGKGAVLWMEQKCSEGERVWVFTSWPAFIGTVLSSPVGSHVCPRLMLAWSQITHLESWHPTQSLVFISIWKACAIRTNAISL